MADYPIRTREQAFLAAIAGEGDMPTPKNRKEAILAKAGGADVDIEPKSGNEYWTLAAMQGGSGATLIATSETGLDGLNANAFPGGNYPVKVELTITNAEHGEPAPDVFYGKCEVEEDPKYGNIVYMKLAGNIFAVIQGAASSWGTPLFFSWVGISDPTTYELTINSISIYKLA